MSLVSSLLKWSWLWLGLLRGWGAKGKPRVAEAAGPAGLVARKVPHGVEQALALPKVGDGTMRVGGVQFRCFELGIDGAICDEVRRAGALVVQDGLAVAHDFVCSTGQVLVWQYWTLGTADLRGKSTANPVKPKDDTRVWWRCYQGVA
jgi:hypothetical protein